MKNLEKHCKRELLAAARLYAKAEKVTLTTVSRRIHGAAHFLEAFRRGDVTMTLRKYDEMMRTFERLRKDYVHKGVGSPAD